MTIPPLFPSKYTAHRTVEADGAAVYTFSPSRGAVTTYYRFMTSVFWIACVLTALSIIGMSVVGIIGYQRVLDDGTSTSYPDLMGVIALAFAVVVVLTERARDKVHSAYELALNKENGPREALVNN